MRIGYVIEPPYPPFTVDEILALRRTGREITVFNSFRPLPQVEADADDLRKESLYFPPGYAGVIQANLAAAARRPWAYLWSLVFLARFRIPMRVLVLSAYYARRAQRAAVKHLHGSYGTTPATVAMLTARLAGISYSFTCHSYEIHLPNPSLASKLRRAAFVATVSDFNKHLLERRAPGARIVVVRLGPDLRRWPLREAPPGAPGDPRIVCVANLNSFKGHAVLVDACALLRDAGQRFRCLLLGEGVCRAALEEQVARRGLSEVVLLMGAQTRESVQATLREATAFALPSVVDGNGNQDAVPVAIMEAMAVGVPVVSTRLSGIPELVEDGESGLLVEPSAAPALAGALARVLADPALASRLSRGGRRRIEERFNLEASRRQMSALFDEIN